MAASGLPTCRLTIHSSRRRSAARLNSGVRPLRAVQSFPHQGISVAASTLIWCSALVLGISAPFALIQDIRAKRELNRVLAGEDSVSMSIALKPGDLSLSWKTLYMVYRTGVISSFPVDLQRRICLVLVGRIVAAATTLVVIWSIYT